MARLSVENFSNPSTPNQSSRKSSRFKELFKGGQSRSNLSPLEGKASPQSTSPPKSPIEDIKPGFERVGLVPSERPLPVLIKRAMRRASTSHRESPQETLARQEQELKGVSAPHGLDTKLDASAVKHTSMGASPSPTYQLKDMSADKQSEAAKATAEKEMINRLEYDLQRKIAEREQATTTSLMRRGAFFDILAQQDKDEAAAAEKKPGAVPENDIHEDTMSGPTELEANNHVDGQCPRITEEKSEDTEDIDKPKAPMNTIAMPSRPAPIPEPELETRSLAAKDNIDVIIKPNEEVPSSAIGPFVIHSASTATQVYQVITVLYIAILFIAAIIGPKAFALTAWRLGLFFATYEMARQQLGWNHRGARDVVVGPMKKAIEKFWVVILVVVHKVVEDIVRVVLEARETSEEHQ
ncbi:hypothetical protein CC80DRAFT_541785 [Byssothecium circinans]|uniref:Uncharacterized protein n=1 Tax=Byssothecium circinans TaxID=147558 RepID=A0A6A5UE96_9PLEO|nr:hypothetical protein CC80DRAFT_541785 [Byssothecium circinans]